MVRKLLISVVVTGLLIASDTVARPIDADLHIRSVDIDHGFDGMDMLMYGAQSDIGRIIVVLRGPERNYIVRKKERIGGVWVNRKSVEFYKVPAFYTMAATHPFREIRNDILLSQLNIGIDHVGIEVVPWQQSIKSQETVDEFFQAFVANKEKSGLYVDEISEVSFMGETLFRTWLEFPKNIAKGWYTAEVYLFSNGQLTSVQSIPILVSKVGFEAFVYDAAKHAKAWYGLICILMALSAGWFGSKLFKRV